MFIRPPQRTQRSRMVPSQHDNPRHTRNITRIRRPRRNHPIRFVQLSQRNRVVQKRERRVPAVHDARPAGIVVFAGVYAP